MGPDTFNDLKTSATQKTLYMNVNNIHHNKQRGETIQVSNNKLTKYDVAKA